MVRPVTPNFTSETGETSTASPSLSHNDSFQSFDESTSRTIELDNSTLSTEEESEGAVGFSPYSSANQTRLIDQDCSNEKVEHISETGSADEGAVGFSPYSSANQSRLIDQDCSNEKVEHITETGSADEGAVGFSPYSSANQSRLIDQDCSNEKVEHITETGSTEEGAVGFSPYSSADQSRLIHKDCSNKSDDVIKNKSFKKEGNAKNKTSSQGVLGDQSIILYENFLRDEFQRRNVQQPPCLNLNVNRPHSPVSGGDITQAQMQLQTLSESFARSPMRAWVQDQAEGVSLQTLNFNSFSDLLYGLFQEGGVTWERVVVLFFFCADLSIRAVQEKLDIQFNNILEWSFHFISGERFSQWIKNNGGWVKILQNSMDQAYKMAIIGFCAMGMLAFAAYLWRTK